MNDGSLSGAVTVLSMDKVLSEEAIGFQDLESKAPMQRTPFLDRLNDQTDHCHGHHDAAG